MSAPEASSPDQAPMPFAIGPQHLAQARRSRWRNGLAVAVLGALLIAAALGALGGGASRRTRSQGEGVAAELVYDPIVRSGNWFETVLTVEPTADIKDLTVAVDENLWSRMSIDTVVPDAESAEALDGRYTYHFGEVKAGERFRLKLDGQIQPGLPRRQSGAITVLDDKRPMITLPVQLTVLP